MSISTDLQWISEKPVITELKLGTNFLLQMNASSLPFLLLECVKPGCPPFMSAPVVSHDHVAS